MEKTTKAKQIRNMRAQVKSILYTAPKARDNDRLLVAMYWEIEQPMLFAFNSAKAVLTAFIAGELTNPDDITRTRRMVQAAEPSLRGSRYGERAAMGDATHAELSTEKMLDGMFPAENEKPDRSISIDQYMDKNPQLDPHEQ